jgi:hypothetical protein
VITGPVVDTPSALEFQREIMGRIAEAELHAIAADLDRKSEALRDLLSGDPTQLDRAALRKVLRWVFATRRRADQIIDSIGPEQLAAAIAGLLTTGMAVEERIDRFDGSLNRHAAQSALVASGFDLPSELLHFTEPDRYWLWTRWIWDPATRTGALGLVTTDDWDLSAGASVGAMYLTIGRVTAFVDETGKAAGFTGAGPGLFGVDVLLAAVYGVYMHTVLQMRLTREFNRVIPPLADLVRRLLGVYHLEG